MAYRNQRQIVLKDNFWDKLKEMKAREGRSISELIREALIDLFEKRRKQLREGYDPITDTYRKPGSTG